MAESGHKKRPSANDKKAPGVNLEMLVARVQQMMDPLSTVTHNEVLIDRVGNKRQYDVVIRGQFGGRPALGIMECKDHSRKKGPDVVEAFAKKTENLGANLRIMVSKKGFTAQALRLAKHENIGCVSLLPQDPAQVGFSVGDYWYGVISMWTSFRIHIHFEKAPARISTFDSAEVKYDGKPVVNWFQRKFIVEYAEETEEGEHGIEVKFDQCANVEIEGTHYPVIGITCVATRMHKKKRKWMHWSGDAFYDWHTGQITIPQNGEVVGSAVETDLFTWPDYDGELPSIDGEMTQGFVKMILHYKQKWDSAKDDEVPDLSLL